MDPQSLVNVVSPSMAHSIFYVSKIVGAIAVIIAAIYAGFSWMVKVIRGVTSIRDNVGLLANQHFPHLQQAVTQQGEELKGLKADIREVNTRVTGMGERLEDTRDTVNTLSASFVRHIDVAAREMVEAKAVSAKNEVDIAAMQAAQDVLEAAHHTAKSLIETTKRSRRM